jgi:hypothetical protein
MQRLDVTLLLVLLAVTLLLMSLIRSFLRDRRRDARMARIEQKVDAVQAALAETLDRLKLSALSLGRISEEVAEISGTMRSVEDASGSPAHAAGERKGHGTCGDATASS